MKSWHLHIIILGLGGLLVLGCQKDNNQHIPLFDIEVDQKAGLTTDIFSLVINPLSTSPSNEKLHCRWDWEGDSIFNTRFSNDLEVDHRFFKPGNYKVICEVLSLSGGKAWDTPFLDEPTVYHQFKIMEDFKVSLTVLDPSQRSGSFSKVLELHRTDTCIVPEFIWTCGNWDTGKNSDMESFMEQLKLGIIGG